MRTTTAAELLTLARDQREHRFRVKVKNGSGTYIDLSRWVNSISIDQDIDHPVSSCTIDFTRAQSTTYSLSPLRTDSTLNRLDDGTTYSPQLELTRALTVETATLNVGGAQTSSDWKKVFEGQIDVVHFEKEPVSIDCRDLGAPLVDRWVETEAQYGTAAGRAVETVMQDILDATFGAAVVPLYTPASPAFLVVTYNQQIQSVMDALSTLAQLVGWDVRYKWHDGTSAFRLTFYGPDRTKVVPDYTFGPKGYLDVSSLALDSVNIRNAVKVSYKATDLTPTRRNTVTVTDATSIAAYGRRFLFIQEGDSSPIDTSAEATTMANAALSDLKSPKAEQSIETPYFWPGDLGDLYRFTANQVHFNSNQDWAVSQMRHELTRNKHRSSFQVRGQPCGAYLNWHRNNSLIPPSRLPGRVPYALGATNSDGTTTSSYPLSTQGSIIPAPSAANPFTYNAGGPATLRMWVAFAWSSTTLYKPDSTTITVPASASYSVAPSPTLTQVAGGALALRTRYVRLAYVKNNMLMGFGAEASIAVSANNLLKVTSPPTVSGFDRWVAMVGTASNAEYIQTATTFGSDFTESVAGFDATTTTPYDNTNMPNAIVAQALASSTLHYWYPYHDISFGYVAFASRGATAKSEVDANTQNLDGHVSLSFGGMNLTTPAGGATSSGTPTNGGGRFT